MTAAFAQSISTTADTTTGCRKEHCGKATDTIVRDIVRGRVILSRMGSRTLLGIIAKMAERIRQLEAIESAQSKPIATSPRRRAYHD